MIKKLSENNVFTNKIAKQIFESSSDQLKIANTDDYAKNYAKKICDTVDNLKKIKYPISFWTFMVFYVAIVLLIVINFRHGQLKYTDGILTFGGIAAFNEILRKIKQRGQFLKNLADARFAAEARTQYLKRSEKANAEANRQVHS